MTLTNQQARRILLELYAESHDSSDTMFGVLNSSRLAAIWHACKVLKQVEDPEPSRREPPERNAAKSAAPVSGKMGKAE